MKTKAFWHPKLVMAMKSMNDRAIYPMEYAHYHYSNVIKVAMASQITILTIVYSTIYTGADQWNYQSSVSLAFVWGIHRWSVNSPHKWPVMRKMIPFDDVIMITVLFISDVRCWFTGCIFHILHGWFIGRIPPCWWSYPEGYRWKWLILSQKSYPSANHTAKGVILRIDGLFVVEFKSTFVK